MRVLKLVGEDEVTKETKKEWLGDTEKIQGK